MFKYKITFELEIGQPLNKKALTALANSHHDILVDKGYGEHITVTIDNVEYADIVTESDLKELRVALFPGYDKMSCTAEYVGKNLSLSAEV